MSRIITRTSVHGRVLLALRAGRINTEAIYERFPSVTGCLTQIKKAGHIEVRDGYYYLTEAGLLACPCRNPHATVVAPVGRIRAGSYGFAAPGASQ